MIELAPDQRRNQQRELLAIGQRSHGIDAQLIFWLEDRAWGRERTLSKFKARELVARSPYRAWRHVSGGAGEVEEEQNERSHWHIVRQLLAEDGHRDNVVRFGVVPAIGAVGMYAFSWLLERLNPSRSYRLNADIEDHAAHEYASLVSEHPEWEQRPYKADVAEYGAYESRADAVRQIACDERVHRDLSLERLRQRAQTIATTAATGGRTPDL